MSFSKLPIKLIPTSGIQGPHGAAHGPRPVQTRAQLFLTVRVLRRVSMKVKGMLYAEILKCGKGRNVTLVGVVI